MRALLALVLCGCARVWGFEEPTREPPAPQKEPCFAPDTIERAACEGGGRSRICGADGWSSWSACATPGFRPLPPAPIAGRIDHSAVWTGDEFIVWGGRTAEDALNDGAAYDPVKNTWRVLATAPLGPRIDHAAVWTGKEMVVWGGRSGVGVTAAYLADGATYDPRTNTWRPLPGSPMSARAEQAAVWSTTTQEVLFWGGIYEFDFFGSEGAAFDPAARKWTYLSNTEAKPRAARASLWDGTRMVVVGGECGAFPKVDCRDVWTYDPAADLWEKRSSIPTTYTAERSPSIAVGVNKLTLFGGEKGTTKVGNGVTYHAGDDTFDLVDAPTTELGPKPARLFATAFWAESKLWIYGGFTDDTFDDHGAVWDPTARKWSAMPSPALGPRMAATATSSHDDTFVFGGRREGEPPAYFVHLADGAILRHAD